VLIIFIFSTPLLARLASANKKLLLRGAFSLGRNPLLISFKSAEFSFLLENIGTTKGNLSFQLTKLKEAGYIEIRKSFKGNYPLTVCEITEKGLKAYAAYVNAIDEYFKFSQNLNK